MSESFEKLIIGSAYEGSEGMFHTSESTELINIDERRTERGIFSDAQERYEKTLADRGLEQLQDLGIGIVYPTLDAWVNHRITNERGSKFFPSFVKNKEGDIFFCKAQVSNNEAALQGLEREAERLKNIPKGINAPKLIDFIPAEGGRSALLLTEAINATVVSPNAWFAEDVPDVIRQIKLIEETIIEYTAENPTFTESARALLERAGETIMPDLKTKIEETIVAFESHAKPHFAHGDAGTKNILLGIGEGEGVAYFVDWEFKENGFLGQDAAKLWSELSINKKVSTAFLDSYLHAPNGSIDEARKIALVFGVAVESLAHLAWRNENIILAGKQGESPNLRSDIERLNERIRLVIEQVASL